MINDLFIYEIYTILFSQSSVNDLLVKLMSDTGTVKMHQDKPSHLTVLCQRAKPLSYCQDTCG